MYNLFWFFLALRFNTVHFPIAAAMSESEAGAGACPSGCQGPVAEHTEGPSEPARGGGGFCWLLQQRSTSLLIRGWTQKLRSSVPVVRDCFFQPAEQIVEEDAAGLAVYIVSVASFPELLQVIGVLHDLLRKKKNIRRQKVIKWFMADVPNPLSYWFTSLLSY